VRVDDEGPGRAVRRSVVAILASVVLAGGTAIAPGGQAAAGARVLPAHAATSAAVSYRLQLHDDDTGAKLGSASTRRLLVRVHRLLTEDRVAALVKLIPKPHKRSQRALLRHPRWRRRALLLMSLHLNNDENNVVYPGFVHRCAAGSDYSRFDKADVRRLGRHLNRTHPCDSMVRYGGPVLQVNYWVTPRSRRGEPYLRGLLRARN
jgi:hypothetical protein